jgi:uncharacterized protein YegL
MARDDLVFIAVVLDRSGSMESMRDDAIGGFNSFLKEQQEAPGEALFTLVQFDYEFITVHDGVPIKDAPPLDRNTFVPRGGTALLDAIGQTVNVMEAKIGKMAEDEKPSRMIVAILSDGAENQSREFKKHDIKKMIEDRSKSGWDFMFLSAGLDQFADAHEIGVKGAMYATGPTGPTGMKGITGGVGARVASYRAARASGQCVAMSLNDYSEDQEARGISLQNLVDQKAAEVSNTSKPEGENEA